MPLGAARFGLQSGKIFMDASGGSTATYTEGGKNYKAHTFTSSSNFVINTLGDGATQVFVLGGGGGGGSGNSDPASGGGGGAGGYNLTTNSFSSVGTYPIVVGAGGAGTGSTCSNGNHGSDSNIQSIGGSSNLVNAGGGGRGSNCAGNDG